MLLTSLEYSQPDVKANEGSKFSNLPLIAINPVDQYWVDPGSLHFESGK